MRVLFVASAGVGHAFPMVSLARAFLAAGHEVLFATTGEGLVVGEAGLPVADVSPGMNRSVMIAKMRAEHPELVRAMQAGRIGDLRETAALIGVLVRLQVDGVIEVARQWRPDLVVQSQAQHTGLICAGALGIPLVEHNFGLVRATGLDETLRADLADVFAKHGAELPERRTILDVAPPSMVETPVGRPLRYVPYNGAAPVPGWLAEPPRRPRIAVTLGSVAPTDTGIGPVQRILALAGEIDAEFVLALGAVDPGPLPANVRGTGWLPLNALLPTCAAIVHHGGAGTTMTALDAGVPQLVLPSGSDRYVNAAGVHARGVGYTAEESEVDSALLTRLLTEDKLRVESAAVRTELRSMPTPATVAAELAEWAS
ncbi:nucleotide disphospho-sugar-binding domain-containing protein [Crossiella sp. CA198]|uniref:nucleotide disphospho-sugar-binding domain-containing protein n=1 Tax=Crossiella sp. CA198 TaxID=3455607 RepID=UPI003F8D53E8